MEMTTPQQGILRGREDRREHQRRQILWWGQIEVGTDHLACTVFDLSLSGAKLRTSRPTMVQERVRLVIPPFGGFEGEVVWSRDGRLGVRFADGEKGRVAKLIACRLNEAPE